VSNPLLKDGGRALLRVREERLFAPEPVAKAIGVRADRLQAFENGLADPTPRQLEALARVYGVRPYQLRAGLFPNTPPLLIDFRGKTEAKAALSINGYKAFLFGQRISSFIKSVIHCPGTTLKISPLDIPEYPDAAALSDRFRIVTGFSAEKFIELRSPAKAYRNLRSAVELSGVSVQTTWYDHDDFRGFYTRFLGTLPTIMIHSRGWDLKSRLFTLAHEIAHHLIEREGISDPLYSLNVTEKYCNTFAATLLGPESSIQYALSHTATSKSDVVGFVRNVAAKTLLSQFATAIRLLELNVLSRAEFNEWKTSRVTFGDPKGGFGGDGEPPDEAEKALPRYGYLAALAVGDAIESRIADPVEIESATGIKVALQRPLVEEARSQIGELGRPD
jgi:Zn-dependent peptidase ImmA (M78 family)